MAKRASLSITEPNERWIQSRIDSQEFSSRSEVVNDLIRRAREVEAIRARLIASELSAENDGWVTATPEETLAEFRETAHRNGKI
ncbi:ribbon-helix-helix domain-containing protein [Amaricoccus tamworthensis]|uniref:ribbon-helix-helix domain-containing protein n=1 Tax=Amaricoccus tamworthensis TaxID=57002 RepID=UPI003C7BFBB8